MAKSVFYSFHYLRDVHRVQLVRNINALEGQPLLNAQGWESVRRQGDQAIKNWIQKEMAYKKAVIVLIGQETASRPPEIWRYACAAASMVPGIVTIRPTKNSAAPTMLINPASTTKPRIFR